MAITCAITIIYFFEVVEFNESAINNKEYSNISNKVLLSTFEESSIIKFIINNRGDYPVELRIRNIVENRSLLTGEFFKSTEKLIQYLQSKNLKCDISAPICIDKDTKIAYGINTIESSLIKSKKVYILLSTKYNSISSIIYVSYVGIFIFIVFIFLSILFYKLIKKDLRKIKYVKIKEDHNFIFKEFQTIQDRINKNKIEIEKIISEQIKLHSSVNIARNAYHNMTSPILTMQFAINEMTQTKENKEYHSILSKGIRTLHKINEDLNKKSKKQLIDSEHIITPINFAINEVIAEKKVEYHKNISIKSNINKENLFSMFSCIDATSLLIVLSNIINNSAQASKTNKEIIVEIESYELNNTIHIIITDYGIGIHEDYIDKVFEEGNITKEDNSGIGLSHAKDVIEKFGGSIEIESTLGEITTVTIKLEKCENTIYQLNLMPKQKDKFLVLDDTQYYLDEWNEILSENSISLKLFSSAEELRYDSHNLKQYKYIIFDYYIDGEEPTNGISLLEDLLREKKLDLKNNFYIATSAILDNYVHTDAIRNGVKIIPKILLNNKFITLGG